MKDTDQNMLIVSSDAPWSARCAAALRDHENCRVDVASRGFEALDMLRKHRYSFVVFDDSLPDMGIIELSLSVRDLAANEPLTFVGGEDLAKYQDVWRHCNVLFAGPKEALLEKIAEAASHGPPRSEARQG